VLALEDFFVKVEQTNTTLSKINNTLKAKIMNCIS